MRPYLDGGGGAVGPGPRISRGTGDGRQQLEARRGRDDFRPLRQLQPTSLEQRDQGRQHVWRGQVDVLHHQPATGSHSLYPGTTSTQFEYT
eukprot:scaffold647955_cov37-Prasinocladus_malaysianus.AAC.2